ncbi:hypothetical protein JCM33374_g2964 [Metschnikowia sp. JCM 33374]|nr:hypothetical protein JCM33374_g2964 [Metschnikowia sp. JCM 33374]
MPKPTPRLIFVRHGQTEWSKSGQHTSITDLELTKFGVDQMRNTGKHLIGNTPFQMIKPKNLKLIITSPRTRAKQTAGLLLEGLSDEERSAIPVSEDNDLREWEYGDYEGLLTSQILELRKSRGLDQDGVKWSIFEKGCENGENHQQVTERLDRLIGKIRAVHAQALEDDVACDVLIVGHGHILRCFAARWVGRPLNVNPDMLLDAGGVGVLSYQHHNIDEPAFYLSGAFTVPVEEEGEDQ